MNINSLQISGNTTEKARADMGRDALEQEIKRRIGVCHNIADIGSNMTRAKQRAAATALSDLLSWIRKEGLTWAETH